MMASPSVLLCCCECFHEHLVSVCVLLSTTTVVTVGAQCIVFRGSELLATNWRWGEYRAVGNK